MFPEKKQQLKEYIFYKNENIISKFIKVLYIQTLYLHIYYLNVVIEINFKHSITIQQR